MKRLILSAVLLLLVVHAAPVRADSPISLSGGWNSGQWGRLSSKAFARIDAGRSVSRHVSIQFGAGYDSYDWKAAVAPACVDCEWEAQESADVIPVSAGLRLDFIPRDLRTLSPFVQVSPTLAFVRLSSLSHTFDETFGTSLQEKQWWGAEPGVQVGAGVRIPAFSNGAGFVVGFNYLHVASPSPGHDPGSVIPLDGSNWDWTRSGFNGLGSLNSVGFFVGMEIL